jgi:glycosyltransferase involved in cell wall biosynthesis
MHFPTPFPASHPIVVTMHDLTPLLVEGVMPSGLRRKVYQWQVRRAVSVADRVVTPSSHTLSDVERFSAAARGKGRVTLEGADDFALGPRAVLGERLVRITGERYVLSMGSTRLHKDLPTLLRAFRALAPLHPELRLVLAGEGEDGYLEHHLAGVDPSVAQRVAFTGRVSDDELRTLYAGAAVFAFPSLYEGFGLPPLEAMEMGAPVVVARAASLPEVVGYGALLFEPGDDAGLATAITRVLDDATTRERLIATGHERASELTWAAAAQRTVDVYRELAG